MKKMNEQQLDLLFSQYVDGLLSERETQAVKSLVATDVSAKHRVEELQKLKALLAS